MLNPLVGNRLSNQMYLSIWLLIILVHAGLFYFVLQLALTISVVDSLVFNGIFALIGYNIWYVVRFSGSNTSNVTNTLVTHLLSAIILIALWVLIASNILRFFFAGNQEYLDFLAATQYYRAAIGVLFYALIVMNYYLATYYREVEERKLNESETSRLLKETELSMLKSQINPHFIFNSLNSISSLTLTDPPKAHEMVVNLSSFLRYTISPQQTNKVALKQELAAIEQYLAVEKVRFGQRLSVQIEKDEDVDQMLLPNMILQPLIENAIKYGVYESLDENKIQVRCKGGEQLTVTISNEIAPDSIPKKGKGIGLANVKSRMNLMYGQSQLIKTENSKTHFVVTINFPQ